MKCVSCDIHKHSPNVCVDDYVKQSTQILVVLSSLPFDLVGKKNIIESPSVLKIKAVINEVFPNMEIGFTSIIKCVYNQKPSNGCIKTCINTHVKNLLCRFRPEATIYMGVTPLSHVTGARATKGNKIETIYGDAVLTTTWNDALLDHLKLAEFKKDISALLQDTKKLDISKFKINVATTKADLLNFYNILKDKPELVFDIEGSSRPYERVTHPKRVMCVSFTYQNNEAFIIPIDPLVSPYADSSVRDLALKVVTALCTNKAKKIGHNIKYDAEFMNYALDITVNNVAEDTILMAYLLNPSKQYRKGLKPLTNDNEVDLFEYDKELDDYIARHKECNPNTGGSYLYIPNDLLFPYNGLDTIATYRLYQRLKLKLERNEKLTWLYRNIMMPMTNAYVTIESNGVLFDREAAEQEGERLLGVIADNYRALTKYLITHGVNASPNVGSVEQVASLLLELGEVVPEDGSNHEGIVYVKKSKAGKYTSDDSVINALVGKGSYIAKLINNIRKAESMKSKYIDKPLAAIDEWNRFHPDFGLYRTDTGRSSSGSDKEESDKAGFNTQNITLKYRRFFIASKDKTRLLFARDFSQLELRLEAVIADVKLMKEIYKRNKDIHKLTASALKYLNNNLEGLIREHIHDIDYIINTLFTAFETNYDKNTQKICRNQAKQPNFGFIYRGNHFTVMNKANQSINKNIKELYIEMDLTTDAKKIAKIKENIELQRLSLLNEETALQFEHAFMALFPEVKTFHKKCEAFASKHGYMLSPFGRIKPLPDALLRDFHNKEIKSRYDHAINASTNHPIQAAGTDLKFSTIVEFDKRKKGANLDAFVVNEVHDDVMWDCAVKDVTALFDLSSECMDKWHETYKWLTIPIPSDAKIGFNWKDMSEIKDKNELQQWLDANL